MMDIRYPNITAKDSNGQLQQIKSYLYQLAEQLNVGLSEVEKVPRGTAITSVVIDKEITPEEAESTFNSIKALIIKSADIVESYEDTIFTDFNGKYFAESDFGTYIAETNRSILENSEGVKETYSKIQTITNTGRTGSLDKLEDDVHKTNGYIKRGILPDGSIGVEIGETFDDGTFQKYARFTADRLSFFGESGTEVAYIGAGCLYVVGKTVFLGEIQLGSYKTDTSEGLAFTWIGG
jgi:hypothetical protein